MEERACVYQSLHLGRGKANYHNVLLCIQFAGDLESFRVYQQWRCVVIESYYGVHQYQSHYVVTICCVLRFVFILRE